MQQQTIALHGGSTRRNDTTSAGEQPSADAPQTSPALLPLGPWTTLGAGLLGLAAVAAADTGTSGELEKITREDYGANVVVPAGPFFGIWGVIYTGVAGLLVLQALPGYRDNPRLRRARPWLAVIPASNALWIVLAQARRKGPALVLLWGLLGTAYGLHRALEIGRMPAGGAERWLRIPASLYLGWLSVAQLPTAANTAIDAGWDARSPGPATWGTLSLLATGAAGVWATRALDDRWYGAAFVNALAGIAVRQASRAPREPGQVRSRAVAAVAAGLALAGTAWLLRRGRAG